VQFEVEHDRCLVLNFLKAANSKVCILVEPIDTLVIYPKILCLQEIMNTLEAESEAKIGYFNSALAQILREMI
jgi:hypothetical protein